MHEYPDIYADGYSLSFGPFGGTVTLLRSEPPLDPGSPHMPSEVVARVRLSAPLATAISEALARAVAASMPRPLAATTPPSAAGE
jgi:hypothetical protein